MLDLERCPFLGPLTPETDCRADLTVAACLAGGEPRPVSLDEREQTCTVAAHARCPSLLEAIRTLPADGWSELGAASRVIAEACHLAQARLEVQAARLGPALARLFDVES